MTATLTAEVRRQQLVVAAKAYVSGPPSVEAVQRYLLTLDVDLSDVETLRAWLTVVEGVHSGAETPGAFAALGVGEAA